MKETGLVASIIIGAYQEVIVEDRKNIKVKENSKKFHNNFFWYFFDGACENKDGKCGYGMVIYFSAYHYFHL